MHSFKSLYSIFDLSIYPSICLSVGLSVYSNICYKFLYYLKFVYAIINIIQYDSIVKWINFIFYQKIYIKNVDMLSLTPDINAYRFIYEINQEFNIDVPWIYDGQDERGQMQRKEQVDDEQ